MKKEDGMTIIGLIIVGLIIIILSILILNVAFDESGLILRKSKKNIILYTNELEKEILNYAKDIQEEKKDEENNEKYKEYIKNVVEFVEKKEKDKKEKQNKKMKIAISSDKPKEKLKPELKNEENGNDNIRYVIIRNNNYMTVIELVITNTQIGITKTKPVRIK